MRTHTLFLFIVAIVGYRATQEVKVLAETPKAAEDTARHGHPGGLAYVARQPL